MVGSLAFMHQDGCVLVQVQGPEAGGPSKV